MKPKWTTIAICIVLAVVITGTTPQTAYAADSDVVISEIQAFPACSQSGACTYSTTQDTYEWVEIFNKGTASVNLTGWAICDNTPGASHANCDSLSGTIPAGGYWIISGAANSTDLNEEFAISPGSTTANDPTTIYLNSPIGNNGIGEASDMVFLITGASTCGAGTARCVSDCVSWDLNSNNSCANKIDGTTRAYLAGSDGADDTSLTSGDQLGQSLANVLGTWYQHGPSNSAPNQSSPYGVNTKEAPPPTAIILRDLTANQNTPQTGLALLLVLATLSLAALWQRRRRTT